MAKAVEEIQQKFQKEMDTFKANQAGQFKFDDRRSKNSR